MQSLNASLVYQDTCCVFCCCAADTALSHCESVRERGPSRAALPRGAMLVLMYSYKSLIICAQVSEGTTPARAASIMSNLKSQVTEREGAAIRKRLGTWARDANNVMCRLRTCKSKLGVRQSRRPRVPRVRRASQRTGHAHLRRCGPSRWTQLLPEEGALSDQHVERARESILGGRG